ncbi:tubulin-specific chaperone E [Agrilus planipennis]|uniref:Tubulin-specific chaperone E n=1 Tax=Agrilus planipennis TaxID=224129 RepID=A0A1W4X421_AGRPL|nr:tubulin-specific chaperone E [Agrilus planipennis]
MISGKTPCVGDRIECAGQYGTIKYIGEVEGYPGTWYGIDWDDPERGKHNGIVRDKQYFTARYPRSASFVRPEKVNVGQSAVTAIQSRYGQKSDNNNAYDKQQLLSLQRTMNAPFLELVGFDKVSDIQSDFNKLKIVNIRLQCVNCPGEPNALEIMCPNIVELDISKNLLTKWTEVFEICSQLKKLSWLNVSENLLIIPDNYTNFKFESIKTLICGAMNLNWTDLQKLSVVFPELEELRAPKNQITSLNTSPSHSFQKLQLLDIEDNKVGKWEEIIKLGVIKTLEQLILENTGIKEIKFPCKDGDNACNNFENLKKLTLTNNEISDWNSIGELNKLGNLQELRLLRNPVLEKENYATCFQIVIARIASLQYFNGTLIKPEERKGAEYDYLKKYALEWFSVRDDDEKRKEFLANHNRYLELMEKYGSPEESELKQQPKCISGSLIELKLVYEDQEKIKCLPPTIQVRKLTMLVQRLFNLSERPILVCISNSQPEIEIELDDDGKEIDFYSIQTGDQIIVKT